MLFVAVSLLCWLFLVWSLYNLTSWLRRMLEVALTCVCSVWGGCCNHRCIFHACNYQSYIYFSSYLPSCLSVYSWSFLSTSTSLTVVFIIHHHFFTPAPPPPLYLHVCIASLVHLYIVFLNSAQGKLNKKKKSCKIKI